MVPKSLQARALTLTVAVVAALLGAPAAGAESDGPTRYYVSLGDSLAASIQPNGDLTHGYAEQLHALLAARDAKLKLVKLGCGGESTTSMLEGSQYPAVASSCGTPAFYTHRYPHKTQLAEAVAFLNAHRGFVRLVSIDIGANDAYGPGGNGEIAENLPVILDKLRAAAGPDVPIVGMNYYDPFLPRVWEATHDLDALAAEANAIVYLNDLIEDIYAVAADPVADVESAFQVTDTTLVDGTPLDVRRACEWTWTCAPPPLGPDVHANTDGYAISARAFLAALDAQAGRTREAVG
jgi:lysophospholipase L1-like esterase